MTNAQRVDMIQAQVDAIVALLTKATHTTAPATTPKAVDKAANKASKKNFATAMDDAAIERFTQAHTVAVTRKPTKASVRATATTAKLTMNKAQNGVELYFNGKPTDALRAQMKTAGFRFHAVKVCWYAKQNAQTLKVARAIAG